MILCDVMAHIYLFLNIADWAVWIFHFTVQNRLKNTYTAFVLNYCILMLPHLLAVMSMLKVTSTEFVIVIDKIS